MKKITRIFLFTIGFLCLFRAWEGKSFGLMFMGIGVIIAVIVTAIIEDRRPPP